MPRQPIPPELHTLDRITLIRRLAVAERKLQAQTEALAAFTKTWTFETAEAATEYITGLERTVRELEARIATHRATERTLRELRIRYAAYRTVVNRVNPYVHIAADDAASRADTTPSGESEDRG